MEMRLKDAEVRHGSPRSGQRIVAPQRISSVCPQLSMIIAQIRGRLRLAEALKLFQVVEFVMLEGEVAASPPQSWNEQRVAPGS